MKIINRRSIILIIGLILSLLVFVFTETTFTAYLICLFAILFIGALVCSLVTGRNISSDMDSQMQGSKGMPALAKAIISNGSFIPVVRCNADILVTNVLTGEKDMEKYSFCIFSRKKKDIKIQVKPDYCGCIRIEIKEMTVSDPLRLFERRIEMKEGESGSASIFYMPEAIETYVSPDDVSAYNMESYKYSATSKGSDPAETFDIKAYERGDSFKAIHWKLSSKTDELVIREHGLPVENNVLILIDKNREDITPQEADNETEFAASISYTLLKKEVNHTIGWFDSNAQSFESGRVDSMDSFWKTMRGVISSPYDKDSMSTVDRYIASDTDKDYSAYMFVSSEGTDLEKLMAYGQVDLYRPEDFR